MTTTNHKLRVFLCHASQDKPIVRELYRKLLAEGWIDPWLDEENLRPGYYWPGKIEDAVESADAVIIFISNNSVTKEGVVQKEIRRALDKAEEKPEDEIFIIPLRLDDCIVPRRLKSYHYQDYFPDADFAYKRLHASLEERANSLGIDITEIKENIQRQREENYKREREEQIRREIDEKIRREDEERLRRQAEQHARQQHEERVRKEQEELARQQAVDKALLEINQRTAKVTNTISEILLGTSCLAMFVYFASFSISIYTAVRVGAEYDIATGFFFYLLSLGYLLIESLSGWLLFGPFLYGKYAPDMISASLHWLQISPDIVFMPPNSNITLGQVLFWHGYVIVIITTIWAVSMFGLRAMAAITPKGEQQTQ